jgi:hypothetical protein
MDQTKEEKSSMIFMEYRQPEQEEIDMGPQTED